MSIASSNIPEIKRTINSVYKVETGEIIYAEEFFNQNDAMIHSARAALQLAIQSNMPIYICSSCKQKVKINAKKTRKRDKATYFFAHFKDSLFCQIKTGKDSSLPEILASKYNGINEGILHQYLKNFIAKILGSPSSKEAGVRDVLVEKIYKNLDISERWRRPDIKTKFREQDLVIELQLSTTFHSIVIERETFYRNHLTYLLWIFASFDTNQNSQRTMHKDIYYSHRRNVFILDEEAQIISEINGELTIHCYWQIPNIIDGHIEVIWEKKMITLGDLTFVPETFEVYYYDSNKDFYDLLDQSTQAIVDDWERAKRERWSNIEIQQFIEKNAESPLEQERVLRKQILANRKDLLKSILSGEIKLSAFQQGDNWGFQMETGETIIEPKYKFVKPFSNKIAIVQKRNWGAIDVLGRKVIPFQFEYIEECSGQVFLAKKEGKLGLLSKNGYNMIQFDYDDLKESGTKNFYAKREGLWGLITNNEVEVVPFLYHEIIEFTNDMIKATLVTATSETQEIWCCYDHSGKSLISTLVSKTIITAIDSLKNIDGAEVYTDSNGNYVIPSARYFQNEAVSDFFKSTFFTVKIEKKAKYGVHVCQSDQYLGFIAEKKLAHKGWDNDKLIEGQIINVYFEYYDANNDKVVLCPQRKNPGSEENYQQIKNYEGRIVDGIIVNVERYGLFVDIINSVGLLHISSLKRFGYLTVENNFSIGARIKVQIINVHIENKRIGLEFVSMI